MHHEMAFRTFYRYSLSLLHIKALLTAPVNSSPIGPPSLLQECIVSYTVHMMGHACSHSFHHCQSYHILLLSNNSFSWCLPLPIDISKNVKTSIIFFVCLGLKRAYFLASINKIVVNKQINYTSLIFF